MRSDHATHSLLRLGSTPAAVYPATRFNVPYTHMVKVVHQLGLQGLITTSKGKGGGLRLSHPPERIRLGEVLRPTEPKTPIIDCFTRECPLRFDCSLKDALDRAYGAFFAEMDRYTLAEIAKMPALRTLVPLMPSMERN